jgi:hypothetical protein
MYMSTGTASLEYSVVETPKRADKEIIAVSVFKLDRQPQFTRGDPGCQYNQTTRRGAYEGDRLIIN